MEKVDFSGDSPLARFGHTITPIGRDKAILFGGAVGETGKYIITADTFICDYNFRKWRKLENQGHAPSNRAAHSSVSVDHFFFVYGGALGGGELADATLYQLDVLTITDQAHWSIVNCEGTSPGARYGHVMAYLKPFLIVYGGNTGAEAVGDIWKIDITGNRLWERVNTGAENPPPRVYHSASICKTGTAAGMLVIFGGRGTDQIPLNDAWGLRKHRNGALDWMRAPYINNFKPAQRYQHRSLFVGTLLLIIGGRNNQVGQAMPLDIYDTDSGDWYRLPTIERFRHAIFLIESNIYIHGGFEQIAPNVPTDSIVKLDLNKAFQSHPLLYRGLAFELGRDVFTVNRPGTNPNRLRNSIEGEKMDQKPSSGPSVPRRTSVSNQQPRKGQKNEADIKRRNIHTNKAIRLCHEAIVANFNEDPDVQKVQIDQLPTEHRRLVGNVSLSNSKENFEKIYRYFLSSLFCRPLAHISFPIAPDYADKLLEHVEKIIEEESSLVRMRLPVKIFGDIHGQVHELNRFFEVFGAPTDESPNGDIDSTNYLFLGDYVDRGSKSVETILLLFALKLKFPENIVLLRGGHEDRTINKSMGFGDECSNKFKQNIDLPNSFFNRINRIFDKLPLAALVEESIFCVHGGIGQTLRSISELEKIDRPLRVAFQPKTKTEKIVYELLWSDPCRPNEADFTPNLDHDYFRTKANLKFSEDRANLFCNENEVMTIIRGGQPFVEGFELKDSVVSVYSCSDYGNAGNKSCMLHAMKNEDIIPKILNPTGGKDRWLNLDDSSRKITNQEQLMLRKLNFTPPKR